MTLDTTWWLTNDAPAMPLASPPLRRPMISPPLSPNRRALRGQPHYPPRWIFRHVPVPIAPVLFRGFPWSHVLGGDGLRIYLSGAASNGGAQTDPDLALGNYRSSTEATRTGTLSVPGLRNVTILQASRANGEGVIGSIQTVTAHSLRYTAPGSAIPGPEVVCPNGVPRILRDGEDPAKWIRVQRTSTDDLAGHASIEFVDQFNNVFGLANASNSESTSGGNRYRCVLLRNEDLLPLTAVKFWVPVLPLGSVAVSSSTQLGGSGSGTITGSASAFCGWPVRGWARIENSGGTLREIVYYSSRTDASLTVPSLGRGRLGTSAGAGSATDNVYPVPGIRIGHEAPSPIVGGPVQTIANESTAPSGISWSTARTAAVGISVGTLSTGQGAGLWIHRELPAGIDATSKAWSLIGVQFVSNGVTYTETLAGLYRIAVTARSRYELHVGVGAEPNLSAAPDETFTSLPHTTTLTLGVGTVNYLVVNRRNEYDLVSQYDQSTVIDISGAGAERDPAPSAPEVQSWQAGSGGIFSLLAIYAYSADESPADTWLIYTRFNGTDPVPGSDTPTTVAMTMNGPVAVLEWDSSAQSNGTDGRVIVRVRRTSDTRDSTNTDVYSDIAETAGPSAPSGKTFFRKVAQGEE